LVGSLAAENEKLQVAQATHGAMGTVMAHKVFGPQAEASLAAVVAEIGRLEGLLSRFLPSSEISRLNEAAGISCVKVSPDTCEVLIRAAEFSRACPGCFAATIEPLVALWGRAKEASAEPDEASIQAVLPLVNDGDLMLDPWEMTAGLRHAGQGVDLGGIGKGYAGDRIREVYRQFGVTSAYSNLGGNVVTWGAKPDGSPWRIGIQHPRQENKLIGAVAVIDQSVVTSGDYQRGFIDRQGKRHHHILDPASGYPAESGLISVSIVAEQAVEADALSTIVFVVGIEKGLEVLRRFPHTEAVLVDTELRVFVTRGLSGRFQAAEDVAATILG
jgi:thiamine biosynthesis lipoprotein